MSSATFDMHLRGSIAVGWWGCGRPGPELVVWVPQPRSLPWIEQRLLPTVIRRTLNRMNPAPEVHFIAEVPEVTRL